MVPPRGARIALEHLPADLFGLSPAGRAVLSAVGELDLGPLLDEDLALRFGGDERGALADALERELSALEPHVAVLDAVRQLRTPGAACVVAEALPALLGGKLSALYTALSALRLARELSAGGGPPVVAVLLNAADEHDLSAVNPARVVNPSLDLRKVGLAALGSGRRPFGTIRLGEEHRVDAVGALLRQLLPPGPHRDGALELMLPRDGESLARSFTRSMLGLFGEHGLVVVEPAWLRSGLSHALAALVEEPRALSEGAVGAYWIEEGRCTALRPGGDGWRCDGEPGSRTPAELAAAIVGEPGAFCPGPALRCLAQDAVLPVRARVAAPPDGPTEPVDSAEPGRADAAGPAPGVRNLARRLGLRLSARVPRLTATLVEEEARRALAALGLDLREAFALLLQEGSAEEQNTQGQADGGAGPPAVARELRELARRTAQELLALRGSLAELDPGMAGQLKLAAKRLRTPLEALAERAERVQRNRSGGQRRQLRRLRAALLPGGAPQERVLPALPFVARHGTDWIGALLAEMDPRPVEHVAVHLDP